MPICKFCKQRLDTADRVYLRWPLPHGGTVLGNAHRACAVKDGWRETTEQVPGQSDHVWRRVTPKTPDV